MATNSDADPSPWIALSIGNSRLHWALFANDKLQEICHTPLLDADAFLQSLPQNGSDWQHFCPFLQPENLYPELWLVSVVPSQTALWQRYPGVMLIKQLDIPLQGMYPTLGLDRAIALWCAGTTYGWPTLVVDGGTALTLTGANAQGQLVGGAILPGLGLQMRSLQEGTAGLSVVELPPQLPDLWATETQTAIQSGIVYGAIASLTLRLEQWCSLYPDTQIIFTGGDADLLVSYLGHWHQKLKPAEWLDRIKVNPYLIFEGIAAVRAKKAKYP